jgi:hypothetical protein
VNIRRTASVIASRCAARATSNSRNGQLHAQTRAKLVVFAYETGLVAPHSAM